MYAFTGDLIKKKSLKNSLHSIKVIFITPRLANMRPSQYDAISHNYSKVTKNVSF